MTDKTQIDMIEGSAEKIQEQLEVLKDICTFMSFVSKPSKALFENAEDIQKIRDNLINKAEAIGADTVEDTEVINYFKRKYIGG